MTAREIRNIELDAKDPQQLLTGNVQDCAFFLREIAAQMAEANELLRRNGSLLSEAVESRRQKIVGVLMNTPGTFSTDMVADNIIAALDKI